MFSWSKSGIPASETKTVSRNVPSADKGKEGKRLWGDLATGSGVVSGKEGTLQRKPDRGETDNDEPQSLPCACDCESYCKKVAQRYIDDHLHTPDWYGDGNTEKIEATLLNSKCNYSEEDPCTYSCFMLAERSNGKKFYIVVMLIKGKQFWVGTSLEHFPWCAYNFECPGKQAMDMKLILVPGSCRSS